MDANPNNIKKRYICCNHCSVLSNKIDDYLNNEPIENIRCILANDEQYDYLQIGNIRYLKHISYQLINAVENYSQKN